MEALQKYLGIAFILILVYLVVSNPYGFSSAVSSIANLNAATIKGLQGR